MTAARRSASGWPSCARPAPSCGAARRARRTPRWPACSSCGASPDSRWRRRLEAELPGATGFSPENVREGLARGLAPFRGEALLALVRAELGDPARLDARARQHALRLRHDGRGAGGRHPAAEPARAARAARAALARAREAGVARSGDARRSWQSRSRTSIPSSGAASRSRASARSDEACLRALLEADCVAATGSDASIAALAARVQPPRRLVASGHRLSLAALGPAALRGARARGGGRRDRARRRALGSAGLPVAARGLCGRRGRDTAPDRLAESAGARARVARAPTAARRPDPAAAARFRHECDGAELRAAAGGPASACWAAWRSAGRSCARRTPRRARRRSHRFVRVHPVERRAERCCTALQPLAPHLAGVALAGFGPGADGLARGLADLGASRLCRPGELQSPPLAWRHDGRPVLLPLARFTDRESQA